MTGHPALLAPPPPMADLPSEASNATPVRDQAAISEDIAGASLQASLTNIVGAADDQAVTEAKLPDAVQTAAAEATEATEAPKRYKDFLGQVTDLAFGPNCQNAGPDFKAYERTLMNANILPVFAIADNTRAPLNLSFNNGQDKTLQQFDHLKKRYSELKASA